MSSSAAARAAVITYLVTRCLNASFGTKRWWPGWMRMKIRLTSQPTPYYHKAAELSKLARARLAQFTVGAEPQGAVHEACAACTELDSGHW